MEEITIRVVGGQPLEPGKSYLLEYDREQVPRVTIERVLKYLNDLGIRAICIKSNGHAIRVVSPEEPA
jgi:hypothetical protein